jgi:hypothetical protein
MSTPSPPSSPPSTRRSDPGAILLVLGALLLFVSLFLHWYQPDRSAWAVFEVWDLVLAGCAAVAALAALGRLGMARERSERWMTLPSAGALVIVVVSLLNHPPAAAGDAPMVGIWLALVASVIMLAGVATSMARISLVIEMTERSHSKRAAGPGLGLGHLRRRGSAARPVPGQAPAAPASPTPPPAAASPSVGPQTGALGPRPPAAPEAPLAVRGDDPQASQSIREPVDPAEQPTQAHRASAGRDDTDRDELSAADDEPEGSRPGPEGR